MDAYTMLFDICVILSGVYMLYCAITGKGQIYNSDKVKKGMEEKYRDFMKKFCYAGGVVAVATGVLDYFRIEPYATIVFCIFSAMVIVLIVYSVKNTDRTRSN
ncbi:MAG TPA: hypothetical protein VHP54_04415 [Caproiciproducens sp.]|jgi:hypothetical protein|nr:hypothetical protein [Caproiciproducens sp.]